MDLRHLGSDDHIIASEKHQITQISNPTHTSHFINHSTKTPSPFKTDYEESDESIHSIKNLITEPGKMVSKGSPGDFNRSMNRDLLCKSVLPHPHGHEPRNSDQTECWNIVDGLFNFLHADEETLIEENHDAQKPFLQSESPLYRRGWKTITDEAIFLEPLSGSQSKGHELDTHPTVFHQDVHVDTLCHQSSPCLQGYNPELHKAKNIIESHKPVCENHCNQGDPENSAFFQFLNSPQSPRDQCNSGCSAYSKQIPQLYFTQYSPLPSASMEKNVGCKRKKPHLEIPLMKQQETPCYSSSDSINNNDMIFLGGVSRETQYSGTFRHISWSKSPLHLDNGESGHLDTPENSCEMKTTDRQPIRLENDHQNTLIFIPSSKRFPTGQLTKEIKDDFDEELTETGPTQLNLAICHLEKLASLCSCHTDDLEKFLHPISFPSKWRKGTEHQKIELLNRMKVVTFRFLFIQTMVIKNVKPDMNGEQLKILMHSAYQWLGFWWKKLAQKESPFKELGANSILNDIEKQIDIVTILNHQLNYSNWHMRYEHFIAYLVHKWMISKEKNQEFWPTLEVQKNLFNPTRYFKKKKHGPHTRMRTFIISKGIFAELYHIELAWPSGVV